MWQHWRNNTLLQFKVVSVQLVTKYIFCPLKITQHTAINIQTDGHKSE